MERGKNKERIRRKGSRRRVDKEKKEKRGKWKEERVRRK